VCEPFAQNSFSYSLQQNVHNLLHGAKYMSIILLEASHSRKTT
jgi:hypothetical protein